ncbi:MAG: hypothetical protein H6897_11375 [Rhodobacteraceae bacterium]|jgi:hypothetical protein|uniref:DUF6778 family protein n=1 Tax=Albidovulum sp. TaxID=1872424 RepID=UPI001D943D07|nr:DUF6778 family protein [uncultured Defluviimonas sp.]MCB2125452.1 hypothetical protein [Paracoccaceae bacterium]MCC0070518.1 hypothetical protein [Paracoccaceae bacterium]
MSVVEAVSRRRAVMMVLALAGCGGSFRTFYDEPAPSQGWRISAVEVTVPRTLSVSEEESFVPKADIVWREDPSGDRYNQVAAIMKTAISRGAAGLKGGRPVRLEVTMTRFHAMTFTAETRAPAGVHDIEFDITARDARTGEVLAGPEHVEASFPAMTGAAMARARLAGQSQKSQITDHVARTIASWLGVIPDTRQTFSSVGA